MSSNSKAKIHPKDWRREVDYITPWWHFSRHANMGSQNTRKMVEAEANLRDWLWVLPISTRSALCTHSRHVHQGTSKVSGLAFLWDWGSWQVKGRQWPWKRSESFLSFAKIPCYKLFSPNSTIEHSPFHPSGLIYQIKLKITNYFSNIQLKKEFQNISWCVTKQSRGEKTYQNI